jgi:hypothetical protein
MSAFFYIEYVSFRKVGTTSNFKGHSETFNFAFKWNWILTFRVYKRLGFIPPFVRRACYFHASYKQTVQNPSEDCYAPNPFLIDNPWGLISTTRGLENHKENAIKWSQIHRRIELCMMEIIPRLRWIYEIHFRF